MHLKPRSHPTMDPVRLWAPARFLARQAKWSARRSFTQVLFSWSYQATGPLWSDTAVDLWFDRIIRRTPVDPVRCSFERRTGPTRESLMFFISYGTHTGPMRDLQGCRSAPLGTHKGIGTTKNCKYPVWASYVAVRGPCGPLRSPHGLFTGCLRSLDPYGGP